MVQKIFVRKYLPFPINIVKKQNIIIGHQQIGGNSQKLQKRINLSSQAMCFCSKTSQSNQNKDFLRPNLPKNDSGHFLKF